MENRAPEFWVMALNSYLVRRRALLEDSNNVKDINKECGYPETITEFDYKDMYDREGLSARVVSVLPEESWAMEPEIYEIEEEELTPFEGAWIELAEEHNLYHYLERIDEVSGIGAYGLLLFGLDDGQELKEPVRGSSDDGTFTPSGHKLLYLRTFDQTMATVNKWENDKANPRYGLPLTYNMKFVDLETQGVGTTTTLLDATEHEVHWSRVLHVADNRKTSEVFGIPRMKGVFNRLLDIRKVLSGSGEMFWKGAFPGFSFEMDPSLVSDTDLDQESIKDEFFKYSSGLQRYLAITGLKTNQLSPQVASPEYHIRCQLEIIAVSIKTPIRVLLGSEEAKLASTQDARTWNKRVRKRQKIYLTPMLLRPFVKRLIGYGVLPQPRKKFFIDWPDLNTPTDADRAEVAATWTEAMALYCTSGVEIIIPPKEFFTKVFGMAPNMADAIVKAAASHTVATKDVFAKPNPGQNGRPTSPKSKSKQTSSSGASRKR